MQESIPEAFSRGGPRTRGIREHLERARFLLSLSEKEESSTSKYHLMLASMYSCRAICELMLEAAEKQEVKSLNANNSTSSRNALEALILPKLPYYSLIERIRIHDFHRFGLVAPNPEFIETMYGGPIKLTAQRGMASIAIPPSGPVVTLTGGSSIKMQRPLLVSDGKFFDDDSSTYVDLGEILNAFLAKAPQVVSEFAQLVQS
jgi:hypothetical protein